MKISLIKGDILKDYEENRLDLLIIPCSAKAGLFHRYGIMAQKAIPTLYRGEKYIREENLQLSNEYSAFHMLDEMNILLAYLYYNNTYSKALSDDILIDSENARLRRVARLLSFLLLARNKPYLFNREHNNKIGTFLWLTGIHRCGEVDMHLSDLEYFKEHILPIIESLLDDLIKKNPETDYELIFYYDHIDERPRTVFGSGN